MKNVFSDPRQLRLPQGILDRSLDHVVGMLKTHRSGIGKALLGETSKEWTTSDVQQLQALVFKMAPGRRAKIDYLRILNAGCLCWAADKRSDPVPVPIPKLHSKRKNPHSRNILRDRRIVEDWQKILEKMINRIAEMRDTESTEYSQFTFAALILSAIIYGGLQSITTLAALVRAFPYLRKVTIIADGRVHIELSLGRLGIPDVELRRWQPDVLSAILWMNAPPVAANYYLAEVEEKGVQRIPKNAEIVQRLSELMNDLSVTLNASPQSDLVKLIQSIESVSTFEIGSSFTRYASGQLASVSMTRRALQRYTHDKIEILEEISSAKTKSRVSPITEEWIQTLLAAFEGDDREIVIGRIAKLASENPGQVLVKRFVDFCDFILQTTALSGRLMSIKEAKGALKLVIENLAPKFDGQDPGNIEAAALDEMYVKVMREAYDRAASEPKRRRFYKAIQEFDRYLVHNCKKVPVSPKCNLRGWRELAKVDANPITIELYEKILQRISADQIASPERRKIGMLLVTLAFRCGLRRLEALLPRIEDFLFKVSKVLLIRGHKLKSAQARRKALLKLLSEREWKSLVSWLEERLGDEQKAGPQDFLFGNSKENLPVMPESIFDWINGIMREVTGDPAMSAHQLRHSHASLLFLSLQLSDLDVIPNLFGHLHSTRDWLNESRARREMLYQNSQPTRRHLFLLARDLGHLSPKTSASSYIHFFDWLLRISLDRSESLRPDPELLERASGKSPATLRRWAAEFPGSMSIPIGIWYSRFPELKPKFGPDDYSAATLEPWLSGRPDSRNGDRYLDPEWKLIYGCARDNSWDGLKPADQARAERFRQRLDYLFWLKLGNGEPRHRKQKLIPDRRHPEQIRSLGLPYHPTGEKDLIPDCLASALEKLRVDNAALFQKGLEIFVHRVERNNFVRFGSPDIEADANDAFVYLQFLEHLSFEFGGLEVVSGDHDLKSYWRGRWRKVLELKDDRKRIRRPLSTEYFGPKSTLSVRTTVLEGHEFDRGASFRFALVMAFVVYATLPDMKWSGEYHVGSMNS